MLKFLPRFFSLALAFALLLALLVPQLLWAQEGRGGLPLVSGLSFGAFATPGSDAQTPHVALQYQFLNHPRPQGAISGALRLSTQESILGDPARKLTPQLEVLFRF